MSLPSGRGRSRKFTELLALTLLKDWLTRQLRFVDESLVSDERTFQDDTKADS